MTLPRHIGGFIYTVFLILMNNFYFHLKGKEIIHSIELEKLLQAFTLAIQSHVPAKTLRLNRSRTAWLFN